MWYQNDGQQCGNLNIQTVYVTLHGYYIGTHMNESYYILEAKL